MPRPRKVVPRFYWTLLGPFVATLLVAAPVDAWGLTESEKDLVNALRKEQAEKARQREEKKDSRAVLWSLIDHAVHAPLNLNPVTGALVSQLEATGFRYVKRKFYDEPWMKEMHHKYTTTLSTMVNKAFEDRNEDKAELDRINHLLDKLSDDDSKAKRILEDEKRHLETSIKATDDVIDKLNIRIDAADDAKRRFDMGGDIPGGFQKLLDKLDKEIKDAKNHTKKRSEEPEGVSVETSCRDLKNQQLEIERKLYSEFQRRRNDPGMLLEAQRAQNQIIGLQAQMATCVAD